MKNHYDVIVIGGGVMGLSSAYHLGFDTKKVLLLEQFKIGHDRGASHGEERIFRYAYPEIDYVKLAMQAKRLWDFWGREGMGGFIINDGGLDIGETAEEISRVKAIRDALYSCGAKYTELNATMMRDKYPQWKLDESAYALFSPDSGVIRAKGTIYALIRFLTAFGVKIHEEEPVCEVMRRESGVEVITPSGKYFSERLVITGGAWTNKLLKNLGVILPLEVTQEQVAYFSPHAKYYTFGASSFPVFIHHKNRAIYGFPLCLDLGIKVAFHHDGHVINVDEYDLEQRSSVTVRLRAYLNQYLPEAAGPTKLVKTCLYTSTPDKNFIVDLFPGAPNIAVGAGFSGHGFKFAPAIGRALADLVLYGKTQMHIPHFSLQRFLR